ncbi:hypothetical protein ACSSS7_006618 [Eimeria intestinalis]
MAADENHAGQLQWHRPAPEGFRPSALRPVVRMHPHGGAHAERGSPGVTAFSLDGSSTILGHRLLPPYTNSAAIDTCKLSLAAAAAADCGVTALAAAEGERPSAPIELFAGLTNGQLWHVEVHQQQTQDEEAQRQELRLSAASKQLLCCRMAEAVDVTCCYVRLDANEAAEASDERSSSKQTLMVIVLYSDGAGVVSWPAHGRTTELPLVEGGQRLCVSSRGGFVAISTRKRRLVVFERHGEAFSQVKDFSPLKLAASDAPAAEPTWEEEEKLLLPGAAQLRSIRKSAAWEETEELPSLPETGIPRELHLLQNVCLTAASEHEGTESKGERLLCAAVTDGTLGVWKMLQPKPLMLIHCGSGRQLRSVCPLESSGATATLMLMRSDGSLALLCLSLEKLEEASKKFEAPAASKQADNGAEAAVPSTATRSLTPKKRGKDRQNVKGSAASTSSVEAFLSREAAEAQSEESGDDASADALFNEIDLEDEASTKKKFRKKRSRERVGEAAESDSGSEDSEGGVVNELEQDEGPSAAEAEALAAGVSALQTQLQEAQTVLNTLLRRQGEAVQPVVRPGGAPPPADVGKPWCLFWTHLGHITKTVTADNSVLDIFNFFPGAAGDGVAHRKLADLQNCSTACLCRAGVALAAEGSSHSILEFRSFLDAGSWVKHFPEGEKIVAVAAGDAFVASVTEDKTLRIFTLGGILLYAADVFGRPVSLCASQQLLVVLTQTGYSDGAVQLHCSLLHVHPSPPCPSATSRLPISCFKRRLAAPPAAAACAPDVDILHEGFFDVDSPLDWVGISPGGMPAVKDSSGIVRGLLPVAATHTEHVGYAFKWVKLCSLAEASKNASLFPIVVDEAKGELGVVRLKPGDADSGFPDCSVSEAFFGYAMEHVPLRIPAPDLWSFPRWYRLLRQDKQLKGVGDGGGDAALVPWSQYDELRLQQELAIRQLNHFVTTFGGSSLGDAECETEAREAQRKLQLLTKKHDKFCLRGFAKCTDDKRLHGIAKEMALRLKTENAPQHALSLLEFDTRVQAEKLREELRWQEQQRLEFLEAAAAAAAAAAAPSAAVDTRSFHNENQPPRTLTPQVEKDEASSHLPTSDKKSTIQKLLQWQQQQQQQQQHRKSSDGGLAALFDGQKRRASESGVGRPAKKSFFHKAD